MLVHVDKFIKKIEKFFVKIEDFVNKYINIDEYMKKYISIEKYIGVVIKYPKTVLAIIAVISVIMFSGLLKIDVDNSLEVMMPKDDEEYIFYKKVQEIYGNVGKFILIDVSSEIGLWNEKTFKDVDNLVTDIEEYKDYNEGLESSRLERFAKFLDGKEILFNDLLGELDNDPNFQRTIKRRKKIILGDRTILNKEDIGRLEKELLRVKEIKKKRRVDSIVSAFTVQNITGEDDSLVTSDLIGKDSEGKRVLPKTKKEFDKLKDDMKKNPFFEKGIYAKDPKSGEISDFGIIVRVDTGKNQDIIAREIWDITESYDDLEIISNGLPILNLQMNQYIYKDLKSFLFPMFIVIIVVFFLNFKSVRGVVLPLVILTLSDIWVIGLMGHLGYKITMVGVGLPSLMLAIGSSYSIHVLNQYYIDFDLITRAGKQKGLAMSMSHITITVALAGFTTFTGFITLTTSQVLAIREWAMFCGIGIIICVVLTLSIIPTVFMLLPHKMPRIMLKEDNTVKTTIIDRIVAILSRVSIRHHKALLAIIVVVIILSIIGITRINVETSAFKFFKKDSYIRTSIRAVSDKFGGAVGMDILIDSGEVDGILKPEFLKRVEVFRKWLESDENRRLNIGRTDTFSDFIKIMHMSMNDGDIAYFKIPDTQGDILDYLELYAGEDSDSDGRIDDFQPYVDPQFKTLHLQARFCDREGRGEMIGMKDTKKILVEVNDYLKREFANNSPRITGEPVVLLRLSDYVISSQILTLFLCLIVVGIIIILLFKNYYAGMVALIPMSVAVTINFGLMGWFGIDLDMATAMIAAISIGIGVDDTVHFLNTFRHFRDRGYDVDQTIEKTLAISGKAILYTSVALVLGFSVLMLSSFKPNMYFGILVAINMIATTIGALVVLPSTIKATGVSLEEIESESIFWKYLYIGRIFKIDDEV